MPALNSGVIRDTSLQYNPLHSIGGCLSFVQILQISPLQKLYRFTFPLALCERQSLSNSTLSRFWIFVYLIDQKQCLICNLVLLLQIEHHICLRAIFISFCRFLFMSCPLFIGLLVFVFLSIFEVFFGCLFVFVPGIEFTIMRLQSSTYAAELNLSPFSRFLKVLGVLRILALFDIIANIFLYFRLTWFNYFCIILINSQD